MDYRFWFAAVGIVTLVVMFGLNWASRRTANDHVVANGILGEAEILKCESHAGRFPITEVTYRYLPKGSEKPLTVTRRLDGGVRFRTGERVPVRYLPSHPFISILVGHEARHDAS